MKNSCCLHNTRCGKPITVVKYLSSSEICLTLRLQTYNMGNKVIRKSFAINSNNLSELEHSYIVRYADHNSSLLDRRQFLCLHGGRSPELR